MKSTLEQMNPIKYANTTLIIPSISRHHAAKPLVSDEIISKSQVEWRNFD